MQIAVCVIISGLSANPLSVVPFSDLLLCGMLFFFKYLPVHYAFLRHDSRC